MTKKLIYSSLLAIILIGCGSGDSSSTDKNSNNNQEQQQEGTKNQVEHNQSDEANEISLKIENNNALEKVDIKYLNEGNIQKLITILSQNGYDSFLQKHVNVVYSDYDGNGKEFYIITFNEDGYIILNPNLNANAIYDFDDTNVYNSVSKTKTTTININWMSIIADEVEIPFAKLKKSYQKTDNRKLITKITWTSGSTRTDFDLIVKSPDGQICNWKQSERNKEAWGTIFLRDDQGKAYRKSYEAFSVDLDKMDEYATAKNLFGIDEGKYKFYVVRYSGDNIQYNFSFGINGECSANNESDCPRGNWKKRASIKHKEYYSVYYTPKRINEDRIPRIEEIPYIMRKKGWSFAAQLMEYWFKGSGKNYFVDLNNMQNKFPIIKNAVKKYQQNAKDNYLGEVEISYLKKSLKNVDGLFTFIQDEISLAGEGWYPSVFDDEKKNMHWIGEQALSHLWLDEYTAAFNNSVIRLVANGVVEYQYGYRKAFLSKFGIYLRDSYDFYDDNDDVYPNTTEPVTGAGSTVPYQNSHSHSQNLACWSFESPYVAPSFLGWTLTKPLCVSNKSFRDYNIQNGYNENHGNYRIFSIPIEVYPEVMTSINLN
jgi:hypothetical protein